MLKYQFSNHTEATRTWYGTQVVFKFSASDLNEHGERKVAPFNGYVSHIRFLADSSDSHPPQADEKMLKKFIPHRKKEEHHHAMAIKLGDVVPNFKADSSVGEIDWHAFIGRVPSRQLDLRHGTVPSQMALGRFSSVTQLTTHQSAPLNSAPWLL